jgi:hypothetical protein
MALGFGLGGCGPGPQRSALSCAGSGRDALGRTNHISGIRTARMANARAGRRDEPASRPSMARRASAGGDCRAQILVRTRSQSCRWRRVEVSGQRWPAAIACCGPPRIPREFRGGGRAARRGRRGRRRRPGRTVDRPRRSGIAPAPCSQASGGRTVCLAGRWRSDCARRLRRERKCGPPPGRQVASLP